MNKQPVGKPFSDRLESWLKNSQPKTFGSLEKVFGDKSFAIVFLLLMALPALPIPTGGITHVFEVIVALLALEMIAGRSTIWIPERWRHMELGKTLRGKVIPLLMRRVRWFEKRSNPRGQWLFSLPLMPRLTGLIVLLLTAAAFFSPPFTGLDTLPSLGVVIISLAIILDDAWLLLVGAIVGTAGVALSIGLGAAVVKFFRGVL